MYRKLEIDFAGRQLSLETGRLAKQAHGAVLAESDSTLFFDNNHYFPPDALRREYFKDSGHPVMQDFPDASWRWCYVDETYL